jgi:hypothetical protein
VERVTLSRLRQNGVKRLDAIIEKPEPGMLPSPGARADAVRRHMAKKKPNLDEIMRQTHTVAELTLMLTGSEVLDLAKLVRYVLEHPEQFEDEESRAASRTSDIVSAAEVLQMALEAEGYGYSEDE